MPSLLHGQAEAGGLRRSHRPLRASLRQAQGRQEVDAERRKALFQAKLRALAGAGPAAEEAAFPGGAMLRAGSTGWFYAAEQPARALGRALAWARQQDVVELHVVADAATGVLARRARLFASPALSVWRVDGRALVEAVPDPAPALTAAAPLSADHAAFAELLARAGADVVVEHGVVTGEVLGLEVARVTGDRLEVGVGRHDREAFGMLHGDAPTEEALAQVIDTVRRHRRPGGPYHPLKRLAGERWLRAQVLSTPALVGASSLQPVAMAEPRGSVKDVAPAAAAGVDESGHPVVVVCSVGIDLDLVPAAADARFAHEPSARLVIALPERDDHPVTRALAAALVDPAAVVPIGGDWRSAAAVG